MKGRLRTDSTIESRRTASPDSILVQCLYSHLLHTFILDQSSPIGSSHIGQLPYQPLSSISFHMSVHFCLEISDWRVTYSLAVWVNLDFESVRTLNGRYAVESLFV